MERPLKDILFDELQKRGVSVYRFAKITGIPEGRIKAWKRGEGNPKANDAVVIEKWIRNKPTLSPDSKVEEPAEEYYTSHQKFRLSLKNKTKPIPVTNTKAAAGMVQLVNDEPELILDYIDAPFIGIVDGVVECVGHSMYPVFPNGSRIAVRKLEDKTLIQPGEFYYLIDTNYEGYVKRLYIEDDGLVLASENPDKQKYPSFKRKWEQIVGLFKVKADITKH